MRARAVSFAMDRRFTQFVIVARVGQIVMIADCRGKYLGAAIGEMHILPDQPSESAHEAWLRKRVLAREAKRGPDRRVKHGNYRGAFRRAGRS